ncbi:MAG TPA: hypothetical protein VFB67_02360 [Candidatus Polarisedimenticolaceae bacterium]|nr:hypothetical protein [Candidatus Polarisedimenticolaceae bacterium]
MSSKATLLAAAVLCAALAPSAARATTRELAEVPRFRLTFGQSVLNQLTYETYRTPFDELQTRPYNLLFSGIARRANLTPWPGQEGGYARYVDALIGNNAAANIDNDADAIGGSMIRRESGSVAWGLSAAFLTGSTTSDDANGTVTFSDENDLTGLDLRGGAAFQLGESRVLGTGVQAIFADRSITERSFEPGVGGFFGSDTFEQLSLSGDVGLRTFLAEDASWDIQVIAGLTSDDSESRSDTIDDTGVVTDRFVSANLQIDDLTAGVTGGYNRLRKERPGETEYRGGLLFTRRELGNSDLAYTQSGGVTTPDTTLVGQDPITTKELFGSARTVFQAGETEMFAGARLGYRIVDGATQVDAAGTLVSEAIDDSEARLTLVLGIRQPILRDRLRIVVSGRGDLSSAKTETTFDTGSDSDRASHSDAQYAIGLEGVLANVTLDLAWLAGEEAAVVPVPIGVPSGSRRSVQLDRLVFSAAVSW